MISAISTTNNVNFNGLQLNPNLRSGLKNKFQQTRLFAPKAEKVQQKRSFKEVLASVKKAFSDEEYLSKLSPEERARVEKEWKQDRLINQIAFLVIALGIMLGPWIPFIIAIKKFCSAFK